MLEGSFDLIGATPNGEIMSENKRCTNLYIHKFYYKFLAIKIENNGLVFFLTYNFIVLFKNNFSYKVWKSYVMENNPK